MAVGDCANFPSRFAARAVGDTEAVRIRLESEQNATDQGRYAGRRLSSGDDGPYRDVPWFWTHQAAEKLYIAGIPQGGDECVVRGDPASGSFSVVDFRGGRLAAVESVNMPADHVAARKILSAGWTVSPAEAADLGFDLKAHGKAAGKAAKASK
nr:oxidoreductase C-terminal domain-containing protein [Spelaeicoccus albus]